MTTRGQHRPDAALDFPRFSPLLFSSVKAPSLPPGKPFRKCPRHLGPQPLGAALGRGPAPPPALHRAEDCTFEPGDGERWRGGPREQAWVRCQAHGPMHHVHQASEPTKLRLALNHRFPGPGSFWRSGEQEPAFGGRGSLGHLPWQDHPEDVSKEQTRMSYLTLFCIFKVFCPRSYSL